LAPNSPPSRPPPQTENLAHNGVVGGTRDELATGRDSLVTNSSNSDFKNEQFEDLANKINVPDG